MSTRVASLYAEVTAKVDGAISSLGRVKNELNQTGSGAETLGGKFAGFAKVAAGAFAAVTVAAVAAQKAFEFGEMGAGILQVQDSFQHLLTTVGAAPGTFDAMRAAAQGTASDLELMRGGATMLAGTAGELGKAFADALPELTAVARAAAILNPEIGSTGEAMDRLSRGIKKAEPELLDELGILLNLTQVFKAYGESIGKSATDLTKAEKSQAMLNAVLDQGKVLVEQAAGATNEYKTSIDQMHASIENAKNALATEFAPAVAAFADSVVEALTPIERVIDGLQMTQVEAFNTSSSFESYSAAIMDAADAAGYMVDSSGNLIRLIQVQGGVARQLVQENYSLTESEYAAVQSAIALGEATAADTNEMLRLAEAAETLTANIGMSDEAIGTWSERLTAAWQATDEYRAQVDATAIAAAGLAAGLEGVLGQAIETYTESMGELALQQQEITEEMAALEAAGATATERYGELTAALQANQEAQAGTLEAMQRTTAELAYNQVAASLSTQGALDLARSFGLVSEADYALATSLETLKQEFDDNRDGSISAAEGMDEFAAQTAAVIRATQSLVAQNIPVTLENIKKELEKMALTDAAAAIEDTGQAADDSTTPLEDVAGAAAEAADETGTAAGTSEDLSEALEAVKSAASNAAGPLAALRDPLTRIKQPLADAAAAAEDLGAGLRSIPRGGINISVSTSGFPAAISYVDQLASGLNNIPSSVTASVRVQTTGTGGGSSGNGPGSTPPRIVISPAQETYNIYNPLAAAMLIEQKRQEVRDRMEALING